MDGERNHMKRKEPAEGFDLNLRSGNINSTEQAESSNSRANNEAGRSSTPSQQNQVNHELGFAMLAGNQNPWRNIRQRINGPPFGSHYMNSHRSIGPPVMNPWTSIGSTSQMYLVPQQTGGHPSFISMIYSVLHRPFRVAQAHNLITGLTSGPPNHGEGMEAEVSIPRCQMACLDLRFISPDEFYGQPEWEEEPDMHSDLRLDIDNMSYEELLALGEQIGTVSTGLAEDSIDGQMRRYIYPHPNRSGPQMEEAQCCICLEGFHRGDLVGRLGCNHEFHYDCIKEWLLEKNTCPICKSTGLSG